MSADICKKYPQLNICRGEEEERVFKARERVASGRPSRRREIPKREEPPRRDITEIPGTTRRKVLPVRPEPKEEKPFYGPVQPTQRRNITDLPGTERPVQPTARRDFRPVEPSDGLEYVPPRYEDGRRNRSHLPISQRQPDIHTTKFFNDVRKKVGKEREKFLRNLSLGTNVVEHSEEEILNAFLTEAAYRNAYEGTNRAERFVRNGKDLVPELEHMEVVRDPRFTNNEHTAFRNTLTGKRYMSYRGSDADFFDPKTNAESLMRGQGLRVKNASDWGTNLHTLGGQEHKTKRYRSAVKVGKEFAAHEGVPVEEMNWTGHSLGGGQADHVSETIGGKSFSFSPARNPLAPRYRRAPHPRSKIKSVSTIFDPVSLARNAYARMKGGEAPHIQHTNYTAVPGKDSGIIDAHEHYEQHLKHVYRDPATGKLVSRRTTPLRNVSSMIGGRTAATIGKVSTGAGIIAGAAVPLALEPEYDTKSEQVFRGGEAVSENLAIELALSDQMYKINPMFALLDEPMLMATIMDFDLNLSPADKHKMLRGLGIKVKDEPYKFKKPPKAIQKIQFSKRKTQDEELAAIQRKADAYGLTFAQANMIDVESDRGTPIGDDVEYGRFFSQSTPSERGDTAEALPDGFFRTASGRVVKEFP